MTLNLGISPCPNDTFIFDALINKKIDTEDLDFNVTFADVETLNQKALRCELDITKISFYAYALASKDYFLLDSGSAMGFGAGPVIIAKKPLPIEALKNSKIGIPGMYTTAHFLLKAFCPEAKNIKIMPFSHIEEAVLNNDADAGLLIHEGRFTYAKKGLVKLMDLGSWWEKETGLPIPLGGIAAKRSLCNDLKKKINKLIHSSLEYAFANPNSGLDFIKSHSQEMDREIVSSHIGLYVNEYSLSLGIEGRNALEQMFKIGYNKGIVKYIPKNIFSD